VTGVSCITSPVASIVFTDLSGSALRVFRRPNAFRVQASAAVLPLADKSFDSVICSEVLEHLRSPMFQGAPTEIACISSPAAVIAMPHRENLRAEGCRCPKCSRIYHAFGHLRSFRRSTMVSRLPGFQASKIWIFGPLAAWPWPMALLRTPRSGHRCDRCGHESSAGKLSFTQKTLEWLNTNYAAPWYRRHYWIRCFIRKSW